MFRNVLAFTLVFASFAIVSCGSEWGDKPEESNLDWNTGINPNKGINSSLIRKLNKKIS